MTAGGAATRKAQVQQFAFGEWRIEVCVNEGFAQLAIFGGAQGAGPLCHTFLGDGAVAQMQAVVDHLVRITAGQSAGCVA